MTDEEIIDRYFDRNESAIRLSQGRYGAYCRSLIGRILGSPEDVEECLSDLWLRAWESIPPNRPGNLKLYLAKIGRNLACNRLRKQRAVKRGDGMDAVLEELSECIPGGVSAEDSVRAKELTSAVNRFLRTLPERECNVFVRRCFWAESLDEIAKRYGMRKNTVSVTLHRTRAKLRDYLIKEGYV